MLVVKDAGIGTALNPAGEDGGESARQHVGQREEAALGRIEGVDAEDSLVELAFVFEGDEVLPA